MKLYGKIIVGFLLFVFNCYGFKWALAGLTYNSDITFLLGLLGIILLIVTDTLIVHRFLFHKLLKGE